MKLNRYGLSAIGTCMALMSGWGFAQQVEPSLEIKELLRRGIQECREAKTQRRLDLGKATEHFKTYTTLIAQASKKDPTILSSSDSTVKRMLEFCNGVKKDLARAQALPIFEAGLAKCREARVLISNGAFDEARGKYNQYLKSREAALAMADSVLEVYENSYEVGLCAQLPRDIADAEDDYKKQALVEVASQQRINGIIGQYNEALSQCRGVQNIINDKSRYNAQTAAQVSKLFADAKKTRTAADEEYDGLKKTETGKDERSNQKIAQLVKSFNDCEKTIPDGMTLIATTLQSQSRNATAATAAGKDQKYVQIVGAAAKYPPSAARRGINGKVTVRYTVTKTGDVADIVIIASEPDGIFDRAVLDAVSRYKYQPAISNGEPVDTPNVEQKLTFKLGSK